MRRAFLGSLIAFVSFAPAPVFATTVYPIDRAQILAGSQMEKGGRYDPMRASDQAFARPAGASSGPTPVH